MSDPDPFKTYLQMLQRSLSTGAATEHTHRPALQDLEETFRRETEQGMLHAQLQAFRETLIPSWPIE
jgi:hypothetical protein